MKNILFTLALLISFSSFGQDVNLNVDKKVEFSEKKDLSGGYGLSYSGNGVYKYIERVFLNDFGNISTRRWSNAEKEGRTIIMNFANQNNYTLKTINVEKLKSVGNLIITFKMFNKDGSLVINKDDAKQQLIELKEYLDLGIITQKEFDTKAASLKKILLGN